MTAKNKSLICLDLDGTLLNNKKEITPFSMKVLNDLSNLGHKIVLFTGRNTRTSLYYYQQLNLNTLLVNLEGAYINNPSLNKTLIDNTKLFLQKANDNKIYLKNWFNHTLSVWEHSLSKHIKNNGLKFTFSNELAKKCYLEIEKYFLISITQFTNNTKISIHDFDLYKAYEELKQQIDKKDFYKEFANKILDVKNNNDSLLLKLFYELLVYLGYISVDPFYYTSNEFIEQNIKYLDINKFKDDVLGTLLVLKKSQDLNELLSFIHTNYPTLNVTYYQGFNGYVIISITSFYATKKQALRYVSSFYGIALKNTYSFGDSSNDAGILSKTHEYSKSYAVANASNEAKEKATEVLKLTNQDDAVAKKLLEIKELWETK